MSDLNFICNVRASDFPMLSTQFSRTVLARSQEDFSNETSKTYLSGFRDRLTQNAGYMYYHNVMPTMAGLRSVGYKQIAVSVPNLPQQLVSIDYIRTCVEENILMLSGTEGNYILNADAEWQNINGTVGEQPVTTAHVHKVTYVCRQYQGIQKYNEGLQSLTSVGLTGLAVDNILGITSCNNYLVAYTSDTLYWSSMVVPTDFMPSLTSGAGSISPNAVRGQIMYCQAISTGILIYTSENIVHAKYTGDKNFPFSFTELLNSGGITDQRHVQQVSNLATVYVWTTRGCQSIALSNMACENVLPELQDFITSNTIEDYFGENGDLSTENTAEVWASQTQSWLEMSQGVNGLQQTYSELGMNVSMRLIANRYLIISYGLRDIEATTVYYTHALVFDLQLQRWGKFRIPHVNIVELADTIRGENKTVVNTPNTTIGILKPDGSLWYAVYDGLDSVETDACVYFGKLQHDRNKMTTLQSVELENSRRGSTLLEVLTSYDGKNLNPAEQAVLQLETTNLQKWLIRTTGVNHTLRITGSFDIVGILGMVITTGGR